MGKTNGGFAWKAVMTASQIGFSVITPILLFLWIGLKVREWLNLPEYIVVVALLLGFVTGGYTAFLLLRKLGKSDPKK